MQEPEDVAQQVQNYLHVKARSGRETLIMGDFTLYLHVQDRGSGASFVLPNRPRINLDAFILKRIGRIFAKRRRIVSFQCLDRYAPTLEDALEVAGYGVQTRVPVLACWPGQVSPPDAGSHLEMVTISADSAPDDVAENWNINARGFDPAAPLAQPADVATFRRSLGKSRAFTARRHGVGVAAGMYTDIVDGVTELVGIATLEEYRRQGIGGALTAFATQTAFADGATLAFLVADSEEAERVYRRVGYQPLGNLLMLTKEAF